MIINGQRYEYQETSGTTLRYLTSTLSGSSLKHIIAEFNTSTNVITLNEFIVNSGVAYQVTEPTAANTDGDLKFVVLSSAPATKYAGYLYYITD